MENPVTVQVVVVSKCFFGNTLLAILHLEIAYKKAVLSQGNRAMPQLFFSV